MKVYHDSGSIRVFRKQFRKRFANSFLNVCKQSCRSNSGIDFRLVHSCSISVEVQHESTTVRRAAIAEESLHSALPILSPVFGCQNGPRITHCTQCRKWQTLFLGARKRPEVARDRRFPRFVTLHSCLQSCEKEAEKAGWLQGDCMTRVKTPLRLNDAMKMPFSLWHVLASSLISLQWVATRHPCMVE